LILGDRSGGDAELERLAAMPRLQRLTLTQTKLTAAGAQKFHELRPDVTISGDFNIPAEAK